MIDRMPAKKKTSIYLDPALDFLLARQARMEGITKAELIRRTLDEAVDDVRPRRPYGCGVIKGGPSDAASNVDRYLGESGFGQLEQ